MKRLNRSNGGYLNNTQSFQTTYLTIIFKFDLISFNLCIYKDHIGGLIQVLNSIPVKEVIDPAVAHTTKTFEDYLTLIDQKNIKFTEGRAGMTRDIGGATMRSRLNDSSIVVKITFGQVSFLLTGDVEQKSESEMMH